MSESKTYEQMVELVASTLGEGYTVERDELSREGTWVITSPVKEEFDVTPFLGTPGGDVYAEDPEKFFDEYQEEGGWYDDQKLTMSTRIEDFNITQRGIVLNRLAEIRRWKPVSEHATDRIPDGFDWTPLRESYEMTVEFARKYKMLEWDGITEFEQQIVRVFGERK